MLIYNKEWLDNMRMQEIAAKWIRKNLISLEQSKKINEQFVCGYKQTNFFVRTGLFLFTLLLVNSAAGLIMLFLGGIDFKNFGVVFFILGGINYFILEQFVKEKKYFRNGIDDMLLYIALSYFITGISVMVFQDTASTSLNNVLIIAVLVLPVLVFSAIRFADAFVSLVAYCFLLLIIFILINKTGSIGKAVMPFVMMMISYLVYFFIVKLNKIENKLYWRNCLNTVETSSLITLYAAGNYFVVRESSALLFDLSFDNGKDIPLSILFYVLTLAIPIAYMAMGIKNKDRIPLRTGIILAALAILTYQYYFHFIQAELVMIIAGILLIAISWLVIHKLKTPWKGITYLNTVDDLTFIEAESLVIAQTFGQHAVKSNEMDFGEGKFGGGGAGGNF